MVTAPGAHSSKEQDAHEDISVVDQLSIKLWHEHESDKDRIEAIHLEKAFLKARRQAVFNALVPPPPVPALPTTLMEIHRDALKGRAPTVNATATGSAVANISPHPAQNDVVEAFVGATRNPLSNLNGGLVNVGYPLFPQQQRKLVVCLQAKMQGSCWKIVKTRARQVLRHSWRRLSMPTTESSF